MQRYRLALSGINSYFYFTNSRTFSSKLPHGFWSNTENQSNCIEQLAKNLNLKSPDPQTWASLSTVQIRQNGGAGLLKKFKNNWKNVLKVHFPTTNWDDYFPETREKNYWKSIENQRKLLDSLAKEFNIQSPKDWLHITKTQIQQRGGYPLFTYYSSLIECLRSVFPDYDWEEESEVKHPPGYWKNIENQRKFMDSIANQYDIKNESDWKKISVSVIQQKGGWGILEQYPSFFELLKSVYPEYNWDERKHRKHVPHGHWKSLENQRKFMDSVASKLKIETPEQWKNVSKKEIEEMGGRGLMAKYTSLFSLLSTVYPEHTWDIFIQRMRVPHNFWKSKDNQRQFMDSLAKEFNIQSPEGWKNVTVSMIKQKGGWAILQQYPTYFDLLQSVYPEFSWDPLLHTNRVPHKFWQSMENKRKFMDSIAADLSLKSPSDWKGVTYNMIEEYGGAAILHQYPTLMDLFKDVYPEYSWDIFKDRNNVPYNFWKSSENQRSFMDSISRELNIDQSPEGWKNVTAQMIKRYGGSGMLSQYPNLYTLLETVYPEYDWSKNHRKNVANNFWKSKENQRKFLDTIAEELNIKSPEEWKNVTTSMIHDRNGGRLLALYPSFFDLLRENYPEYTWNVFLHRRSVPNNYWKKIENQKKFLDEIKCKYSIENTNDWRKITYSIIIENKGSSLLEQYKSFYECLRSVYPEEDWSLFLTNQEKKEFWSDEKNIIEFRDKMITKYEINQMADWYRISHLQIELEGGGYLLSQLGLLGLFQKFYPNYEWDNNLLKTSNKKSTQRWLVVQLRQLYPNNEIIEEFLFENTTRDSGAVIEFDVFMPELNLAVEYHGEHHFMDIPAFGPVELYQARDKEKKDLCSLVGVKLVVIPFWWDGSMEELKIIINKHID